MNFRWIRLPTQVVLVVCRRFERGVHLLLVLFQLVQLLLHQHIGRYQRVINCNATKKYHNMVYDYVHIRIGMLQIIQSKAYVLTAGRQFSVRHNLQALLWTLFMYARILYILDLNVYANQLTFSLKRSPSWSLNFECSSSRQT